MIFSRFPASIVRPKPFQQPRPSLLSGMKSAQGLARTAALFDIWNPASGTVDQIRQVADSMASQRPAGRAPLDIYQRIFTAPPFAAPGLGNESIEGLITAVEQAEAAGFHQVIIDLSFDPNMQSPADWAAAPRRLAPLLRTGTL